eukprot:COSAG02_NODE_5398_length_4363_cov_4.830675_4_plen_42_part_00
MLAEWDAFGGGVWFEKGVGQVQGEQGGGVKVSVVVRVLESM